MSSAIEGSACVSREAGLEEVLEPPELKLEGVGGEERRGDAGVELVGRVHRSGAGDSEVHAVVEALVLAEVRVQKREAQVSSCVRASSNRIKDRPVNLRSFFPP
jgi:hypothetical protein